MVMQRECAEKMARVQYWVNHWRWALDQWVREQSARITPPGWYNRLIERIGRLVNRRLEDISKQARKAQQACMKLPPTAPPEVPIELPPPEIPPPIPALPPAPETALRTYGAYTADMRQKKEENEELPEVGLPPLPPITPVPVRPPVPIPPSPRQECLLEIQRWINEEVARINDWAVRTRALADELYRRWLNEYIRRIQERANSVWVTVTSAASRMLQEARQCRTPRYPRIRMPRPPRRPPQPAALPLTPPIKSPPPIPPPQRGRR